MTPIVPIGRVGTGRFPIEWLVLIMAVLRPYRRLSRRPPCTASSPASAGFFVAAFAGLIKIKAALSTIQYLGLAVSGVPSY
jgi:hypothetical protein